MVQVELKNSKWYNTNYKIEGDRIMSIENEFDNRAVSKELMNELTNGGFKEFVNFVKQKKSLFSLD